MEKFLGKLVCSVLMPVACITDRGLIITSGIRGLTERCICMHFLCAKHLVCVMLTIECTVNNCRTLEKRLEGT